MPVWLALLPATTRRSSSVPLAMQYSGDVMYVTSTSKPAVTRPRRSDRPEAVIAYSLRPKPLMVVAVQASCPFQWNEPFTVTPCELPAIV